MIDKLTSIRKMVDIETRQGITQGSIFNYAYNELYEDEEILGMIITARCDIHNDKVRKYSYLPIVPFSLWRERELSKIIKRRKLKSVEKEVKIALEQHGFSQNTLSIYGIERTIDVVLAKGLSKTKEIELTNKIKKYGALISECSYKLIYDEFNKDLLQYVKEIIENKVLEYYFIDDVPGYGSCVINLRDVSHLDSAVASQISRGIEFDALSGEQKQAIRAINAKTVGGMAYLVGSVRSPFIELIMQRFADLFTRIGVDDPCADLHFLVCKEGIS